tara:strand:+ start:996 stop:1265 length:270 start_codon:yes stop_codon:yes gene_type:complete
MSWSIWIVVGTIFILVWCWLIWEAWNSPIMPDNYNEQGINPDHERLKERINGSKDEEQHKVGFYNGKTDTWIEDNTYNNRKNKYNENME